MHIFRQKLLILVSTNVLHVMLLVKEASRSKWKLLVRKLCCLEILSNYFSVPFSVPLNLDESKYKKKVFAKEGEEVTLGCPVSGFPVPQINWVVDGTVVEPGKKYKGATLSNDGLTVSPKNMRRQFFSFFLAAF